MLQPALHKSSEDEFDVPAKFEADLEEVEGRLSEGDSRCTELRDRVGQHLKSEQESVNRRSISRHTDGSRN